MFYKEIGTTFLVLIRKIQKPFSKANLDVDSVIYKIHCIV